MKKPRLVFFGNERLATGVTTQTPVLKALIAAGYEIEAVIANHVDSQSRQGRDLEVGPVAQTHNIPIILSGHTIPIAEKVAKHQAELAVLVAFGQIVSQSVIDMFPHGIINIHPSLLPQYRGATPVETTILNGATTTGVSLMKLVKEMDAGPVFAQQEFNLSGHESKQKLANQLGELGAKMLIESLPKIVDGSLVAQPQIGKPTFTKRISKQDGRLDPSKSAAQLEREVRAYVGWPKSYFDWQGKTYIVHKANVATAKIPKGELKVVDKKLLYGCKDGSLEILEIQPANKPKMNAEAFINGIQI